MIFRSIDITLDYRDSVIIMRRMDAMTGVERQRQYVDLLEEHARFSAAAFEYQKAMGALKDATEMPDEIPSAPRMEIDRTVYDAAFSDLASHLVSVDGQPIAQLLGDDVRAGLNERMTAADVIGLWLDWYKGSVVDEVTRKKSPES